MIVADHPFPTSQSIQQVCVHQRRCNLCAERKIERKYTHEKSLEHTKQTIGGLSVTSRPTGFLVVTVEGHGESEVYDKSYAALVDPHTKSNLDKKTALNR